MSGSEGSLSREELLAALADRDATIAALLAEIAELKRRLGMDSPVVWPRNQCQG
jgi:hypothetical protein